MRSCARSRAGLLGRTLALVIPLALSGCSRGGGGGSDSAVVVKDAAAVELAPLTKEENSLWEAAGDADADGSDDELVRLVSHVGCAAVLERVGEPAHRVTALRALGSCRNFAPLAVLAEFVASKSVVESNAALESVTALAARPRPSIDPEDALELRSGCDRLVAFIRSAGADGARRRQAYLAVQMLADRGCVARADLDGLREAASR